MRGGAGRWIALLLAVTLLMTGCGSVHFGILSGSGLSGSELFTDGEETLSKTEGEILLWSVGKACEEEYGPDIWTAELEDGTVDLQVKTAAKSWIKNMFLASRMAVSEGLTVSGAMQDRVDRATEAYLSAVPEREQTGKLETAVEDVFTRMALAGESYGNAMSADPGIADEDARVVRVWRLFLPFGDEEEKAEQKKKADRILAGTSGTAFPILALEYGDGDEVELELTRDDLDRELEAAVFALADGEMTDVMETDGGYVIFCCENSNVEEKTAARLEALRTARLRELYESALASYREGQETEWNSSVWTSLSVNDGDAWDVNIFEIYEEIFVQDGADEPGAPEAADTAPAETSDSAAAAETAETGEEQTMPE